MSGLTVGYLSIDELQLELKLKNGTPEEIEDAKIIMPILAEHHLLLSTLLVANALAMETLPICLDKIVPAVYAVLISTVIVVIFGEILPQAYCTGPSQIKIARTMAPVVKILELIFWVICKPISMVLDRILGTHHKTRFVKADLKAIIELHQIEKKPGSGNDYSHDQAGKYARLTPDEAKVINSTIDLRDTPVTKEMTLIDKVFMQSDTAEITKEFIQRVSKSGFSKIPIYEGHERNKIVGILRVKSLVNYADMYLGKRIKDTNLALSKALIVSNDTSMLEMLMLFQEKKAGIALISERKVKDKLKQAAPGEEQFFSRRDLMLDNTTEKLVGLISLKDILEEILESKIEDEDPHQPVTLMSTGVKKKNVRIGEPLREVTEAEEKPEASLKRPLLKDR